jgi:hypothetical protein
MSYEFVNARASADSGQDRGEAIRRSHSWKQGSNDPAIGTDDLSVDPAPVGAGKKGDHSADVTGLSQALQWASLVR